MLDALVSRQGRKPLKKECFGRVGLGLGCSGPAEDCTEGDDTKRFHLERLQKADTTDDCRYKTLWFLKCFFGNEN